MDQRQNIVMVMVKVKMSHYTPWMRREAEEVKLLLIVIGTRWDE
jgi:hypothetical protein